jgi:hypothetical protein
MTTPGARNSRVQESPLQGGRISSNSTQIDGVTVAAALCITVAIMTVNTNPVITATARWRALVHCSIPQYP